VDALPVRAGNGFAEASAVTVRYLETHLPLGAWSVSRFDGERQVHLTVADRGFGLAVGTCVPWDTTLCERMLAGAGPAVATDAAAVPAYAARAAGLDLVVGTYVGVPIRRPSDGELFGTLCGLDRGASGPEIEAAGPLLELLVEMLGTILEADLARSGLTAELERTETLAHTDALTGLRNRRGWDRVTALEDARLRRFGDPGAVCVLDLDDLKLRNDRHGHDAGDQLLVEVAEALRGAARRGDVLARLGGDEFAVLAPGTLPSGLPLLVERLRVALDDAGVAVSVGGAVADPQLGYAGALARADAAMYEDKRRRRAARAADGSDVAAALRRTAPPVPVDG
jgi:diguanylate cyclase